MQIWVIYFCTKHAGTTQSRSTPWIMDVWTDWSKTVTIHPMLLDCASLWEIYIILEADRNDILITYRILQTPSFEGSYLFLKRNCWKTSRQRSSLQIVDCPISVWPRLVYALNLPPKRSWHCQFCRHSVLLYALFNSFTHSPHWRATLTLWDIISEILRVYVHIISDVDMRDD